MCTSARVSTWCLLLALPGVFSACPKSSSTCIAGSADYDSSILLQTPVQVSQTMENLARSEEKQENDGDEKNENDDGDKLEGLVDHDHDDGDDYHDDEEGRAVTGGGSEQEEGDEEEAQDESGEDENVEDGLEDQEAKDAEMEKEGGKEEEGQVNFAEVSASSSRRRGLTDVEAGEAKEIDRRVGKMRKQVNWAKKSIASLEHDTCIRPSWLSTCGYCPSSPETCGHYCVARGKCAEFVLNIVVNFASLALNFAPGGPSIVAMKKAAKLTKAALVKSIVAAAKAVGAKMLNKVKGKLIQKMKKEATQQAEDLANDILTAAVTEIAAVQISQSASVSPDIKQAAEDVIAAVDPTGVYDVVASFKAKTCHPIYDMPKVEWWQYPTQEPRHRRRRSGPCPSYAVCSNSAPVRTTAAPGDCQTGYYQKWSAGTSSYGCSRCYGSVRRRRASVCTGCPSGKVSSASSDDCMAGGPPPLKTTCRSHSDCYDSYWKWPKVLCTSHGCKEQ